MQRKSATIRLVGDNFDEHYCERSAQEEKRIIGYPRIEVEVKTARNSIQFKGSRVN